MGECDSNPLAIFPHFSIDFVQISLRSTILSEETKGQGRNFTPAKHGIIFRNLIPGQGSSLDVPAAPRRMFVGQVPPPPSSCIGKMAQLWTLPWSW